MAKFTSTGTKQATKNGTLFKKRRESELAGRELAISNDILYGLRVHEMKTILWFDWLILTLKQLWLPFYCVVIVEIITSNPLLIVNVSYNTQNTKLQQFDYSTYIFFGKL